MQREKGAALIVSLVLLVAMMLLAVVSINASSVNLLIVGNMQSQQEAEAIAVAAIEEVLSDASAFENPAVRTITVDGRTVEVSEARCSDWQQASGYSATHPMVPWETNWRLSASLTDGPDGSQVTVNQGVKMRMLAESC